MGKVGPPGAACAGVLNVGGLPRPVCSLFITLHMKYAETECPVILIVDCNKSHVTAVLPVLLRKWHCGESSCPIHHTDCNIYMSHSVDQHFRGNALYRVCINYWRILQNHIFTNTEQKYMMSLPFERGMFAVS